MLRSLTMAAMQAKQVAPSAKNLSESVAEILKNYQGPVDVSIVTNKIKNQHPEWKLQERRVKKFVRRHRKGHKNPAGADDDATAAISTITKGRGGGLLRIFSSRRKNDSDTTGEKAPSSEKFPDGTTTKFPADSTPNSSVPPSPISEAQSPSPLGSPVSVKDGMGNEGEGETGLASDVDYSKIAYETDDSKETNPKADFCDACVIM